MTDNNLQSSENEEVVALEETKSSTEVAKAAPKKEKEAPKKVGAFAKIGKFFKDTKSEIKKVVWPTKNQIINNTIVVIVMIAIIGSFIALLDLGFTKSLEMLLGLVK